MNRAFLQSLLVFLCVAIVAVWQKTMASQYLVPTFGILALAYAGFALRNRRKANLTPATAYLVAISSLLLIAATGSMASPLFFLVYFISFLLAFLLEPIVVFVFCFSCCAFFLPEVFQADRIANLAKISSVLLITPLAFFFGEELLKRRRSEIKSEVIAEEIVADVSELVQSKGGELQDNEVELLKDIVDESRELEKE